MIDENYLLENGVNYKKGIELLGDLETYNDSYLIGLKNLKINFNN